MSSKPDAGINHKMFGVTSEGVQVRREAPACSTTRCPPRRCTLAQVFLDAALRHCGIDARTTPFTIKLTGGPDGDVAGNGIRVGRVLWPQASVGHLFPVTPHGAGPAQILQREYGRNVQFVGVSDGSGVAEDPQGGSPTQTKTVQGDLE